ncbi:hypothetical protein SAMN03159353_103215 [Cedecea sp. NFIX57]|nr:hypothetical protein SAMN03159353_103215 [Cedecea sp. NFIX57]
MKKYLLPLLAGACLLAGCSRAAPGAGHPTVTSGEDVTQNWLNSLALVQPDVTRVLTGVRATRRTACHEQLDKEALFTVAENSPTFARLLRQTTWHSDDSQAYRTLLRRYARCDVTASSI